MHSLFRIFLFLLPVLLLEVGVNIHACGNRAEQEHDDRQRGRTVVGQILVELVEQRDTQHLRGVAAHQVRGAVKDFVRKHAFEREWDVPGIRPDKSRIPSARRFAAHRGDFLYQNRGHAPGFDEFALRILFYARCRAKDVKGARQRGELTIPFPQNYRKIACSGLVPRTGSGL